MTKRIARIYWDNELKKASVIWSPRMWTKIESKDLQNCINQIKEDINKKWQKL